MKLYLFPPLLGLLVGLVACDTPASASEATANQAAPVAPVTAEPAPAAATPANGLAIGDIAPDFSLTGTDGATHSLASLRDANGEMPKGYVVTFTCNTCPFARGYEERLVALHERLSARGYPVVAIQPNDVTVKPGDSMEAMQQRAAERGFGFPYLLDKQQEVYPVYGATKTPEIYLLDADRRLRYHGAIDDSAQDAAAVTINYVDAAVDALEAGTDPEPAEVKAIGCSIKAK